MQEQIFTITAFQRVIPSNIKGMPEKIEPGVKLHDLGRQLFKWNGSTYEKTQIPELLKELSNFGIG